MYEIYIYIHTYTFSISNLWWKGDEYLKVAVSMALSN